MGAFKTEAIELDQLTADPESPPDGKAWYNSTEGRFKGCRSNTIIPLDYQGPKQFFATDFDPPNNSDWAVNALAPIGADSNNAGLTVRRFHETTVQGVGFPRFIPAGMTKITLTPLSRAETAPAAPRTVGLKLYARGITGTVSDWSAGTVLADIDIPTSEIWLPDTQTITLATLGLTAGEMAQFQLCRVAPGGTNLELYWNLYYLGVDFM